MRKAAKRLFVIGLGWSASLLLAAEAGADPIAWKNAVSGNWNIPGNWNPAAASDKARLRIRYGRASRPCLYFTNSRYPVFGLEPSRLSMI